MTDETESTKCYRQIQISSSLHIIIHSTTILIDDFFLSLVQDNNALQNRLADATTQEEIKSMHDELSILDEVR